MNSLSNINNYLKSELNFTILILFYNSEFVTLKFPSEVKNSHLVSFNVNENDTLQAKIYKELLNNKQAKINRENTITVVVKDLEITEKCVIEKNFEILKYLIEKNTIESEVMLSISINFFHNINLLSVVKLKVSSLIQEFIIKELEFEIKDIIYYAIKPTLYIQEKIISASLSLSFNRLNKLLEIYNEFIHFILTFLNTKNAHEIAEFFEIIKAIYLTEECKDKSDIHNITYSANIDTFLFIKNILKVIIISIINNGGIGNENKFKTIHGLYIQEKTNKKLNINCDGIKYSLQEICDEVCISYDKLVCSNLFSQIYSKTIECGLDDYNMNLTIFKSKLKQNADIINFDSNKLLETDELYKILIKNEILNINYNFSSKVKNSILEEKIVVKNNIPQEPYHGEDFEVRNASEAINNNENIPNINSDDNNNDNSDFEIKDVQDMNIKRRLYNYKNEKKIAKNEVIECKAKIKYLENENYIYSKDSDKLFNRIYKREFLSLNLKESDLMDEEFISKYLL